MGDVLQILNGVGVDEMDADDSSARGEAGVEVVGGEEKGRVVNPDPERYFLLYRNPFAEPEVVLQSINKTPAKSGEEIANGDDSGDIRMGTEEEQMNGDVKVLGGMKRDAEGGVKER